MVEVFKYTERIVAMVRPRKLLFMAIGKFSILVLLLVTFMNAYRRRCTEGQNESTTVKAFPFRPRSKGER